MIRAERGGRKAVLAIVLVVLGAWAIGPRPCPQPAAAPAEDALQLTAEDIQAQVQATSHEAIATLRSASLGAAFGPEGLPARGADAVEPIEPPMRGVRQAFRLTVATEAGPNHPVLLLAGGDRLAIYHAGHRQDPLVHGREPIQALLAAGFDVLAVAMPAEPHDALAGLLLPLRPFLEPVAVGLNEALARGDYRAVVMLGLSGGGWTTVVYAALDPRVSRSYPVAGSLPMALRTARDIGDFEQALPGMPVGYLDLYLMATDGGRRQLQVFSRRDPCCFAGSAALTYGGDLSARAKHLGGQFGVLVVEHDVHEVPPAVLMLAAGL